MNKSYRSIWNEKVGTFVAVAETAMASGKKSSGAVWSLEADSGSTSALRNEKFVARAATGVGAAVFMMLGSSSAWADAFYAGCGTGTNYAVTTSGGTTATANYCNLAQTLGLGSFNGLLLADDNVSPTAWMAMGNGVISMGANSRIQMTQYLDMANHSIIGVLSGSISSGSTDAINGGQLFSVSTSVSTAITSMSTSVSTGLGSLSTNLGSLSTGWNSSSISLSTGLGSLSSAWASTSTSMSTGIVSISAGFSSMSSSTSTTMNSMSTAVNSVSTTVNSLSAATATSTVLAPRTSGNPSD
jgi:trimeric autotransporter adhesin